MLFALRYCPLFIGRCTLSPTETIYHHRKNKLVHEFHEACHSVTFIVLVNSHQRWKQTRFRVCFHLWCELTSTMNVTEWQVSWNSCWEIGFLCTYPVCLSPICFAGRHICHSLCIGRICHRYVAKGAGQNSQKIHCPSVFICFRLSHLSLFVHCI